MVSLLHKILKRVSEFGRMPGASNGGGVNPQHESTKCIHLSFSNNARLITIYYILLQLHFCVHSVKLLGHKASVDKETEAGTGK
jgi:hypothetical protein